VLLKSPFARIRKQAIRTGNNSLSSLKKRMRKQARPTGEVRQGSTDKDAKAGSTGRHHL